MRLYVRFMFSLAFGLLGVGFVLKVLLDTLFNEWDVFSDVQRRFQAYISGKRHAELIRPEDLLMEMEKSGAPDTGTRLLNRRREQLQELEAVENRLNFENAQPSDTLASIIPS